MSRLLEKASEEANSGNKDVVNKVRHLYLVLQMPMRRSSRDFQFINTSNPDERTFLLKNQTRSKSCQINH